MCAGVALCPHYAVLCYYLRYRGRPHVFVLLGLQRQNERSKREREREGGSEEEQRDAVRVCEDVRGVARESEMHALGFFVGLYVKM